MLNKTAYCLFVFFFKHTVLVYLSNLWVSASHSKNINMIATTLYILPVYKLIHKTQMVWQIYILQCSIKDSI